MLAPGVPWLGVMLSFFIFFCGCGCAGQSGRLPIACPVRLINQVGGKCGKEGGGGKICKRCFMLGRYLPGMAQEGKVEGGR